jgi:hypothetical protein
MVLAPYYLLVNFNHRILYLVVFLIYQAGNADLHQEAGGGMAPLKKLLPNSWLAGARNVAHLISFSHP